MKAFEILEKDGKVPSKEQVVEIMKKVEDLKLEALSDLSNPFKVAREKFDTVLDLEVYSTKIEDFIEVDNGISYSVYTGACRFYNLLKTDEEM